MLLIDCNVVCIPWNRKRKYRANVKSNNVVGVIFDLIPGRPSNSFKWIYKIHENNRRLSHLNIRCYFEWNEMVKSENERNKIKRVKKNVQTKLTSPFSSGTALENCVEQMIWSSVSNVYGSFWPGWLYRFWQSSSFTPKYCQGKKSTPSNERSRIQDAGRGEIADFSDTNITW